MSEKTPSHGHGGHRQRLLAKLESGVLCDHEYLEVLLFSALPRKNTNDLAHRLMARFGSIPAVFSASIEQLTQVNGVGVNIAAHIFTVGKLIRMHSKGKELVFPREYKPELFCAFVKSTYASLPFETLECYLLDEAGRLYKRESFSTDESLRVTVDIEEFNGFLNREKPSGIVLVHTHPVGDMRPSQKDDGTTKALLDVAKINNVVFCDHIIYSPQGLYSYRLAGKLGKTGGGTE